MAVLTAPTLADNARDEQVRARGSLKLLLPTTTYERR